MLKTKHLVLLVVVLAVLLGISLVQKANHKKSTSGSAVSLVLDGILTRGDLSRITISHGLEINAVDLRANGDEWTVASAWNAAANGDRIDTLLRNLGNLSGEFRSSEESVVADYGLAENNSVRIRAFGPTGDEVLALDVGNQSERAAGQFVKVPGKSDVYLSQTSVLSHLGLYDGPARPKSAHFVKLEAVKEDRLAVNRIVLENDGQRLEMAKEFAMTTPAPDDTTGAEPTVDRLTWEWKSISPQAKSLAKTKADGVLGALVNIRAVDVDDPAGDPEAYGLARPARRATLVLEDGRTLVLEFGASREALDDHPAGTWMRIQGEPTIWIVTEYAVGNAFKKLDELLPEQ